MSSSPTFQIALTTLEIGPLLANGLSLVLLHSLVYSRRFLSFDEAIFRLTTPQPHVLQHPRAIRA